MTTLAGRDFVPADLDATSWEAIEPYWRSLLERPVGSIDALESWILDRSELDAACSESRADLYIRMTCATDDTAAQEAYRRYVEAVSPRLEQASFELDRRQTELSRLLDLESARGGRYAVLVRDTAVEVDLFREENIPIKAELRLLAQSYDQMVGAMTVEFDGAERTLPQMGVYQESVDRSVRESAWRAVAGRRLRDADAIDDLYERMIEKRDRVARQAGFADYVGYAFRNSHRFDYGVEECRAFHEACEKVVVPFMRRADERRRAAMGLDALRPWDLSVDVKGRPPLRPFTGGRELMERSIRVFGRLDPRLSGMLAELGDGGNSSGPSGGACLDLDSRKGKAPWGYQYMRDRSRRPFIFMNASGLHRDMSTMLHEAGHAFHSILCRDEPLLAYRHSPIEFAEVASMSMELLTMPYWGVFYENEAELSRARRRQIEDGVTLLPWIATIDAFQHWVYSNPDHSREDRTACWLGLDERLGHAVSWEGIEGVKSKVWQRQGHLFDHPFYYIEYGIAQIGALGLWARSMEEGPGAAVEAYLRALSLGGSRPLPELFAAAGLAFDFGPAAMERIVDRAERELEKLPE